MLELRGYQRDSLDTLAKYLRLVVQSGNPSTAFYEITERAYKRVSAPRLESMPYVCLRVPTGGGKTFMACHALGIVAREYLRADRAVCLWLVPSNTIREQTIRALREPRHPYRQALEADFPGRIAILDLADALYVPRGVLDGNTTIIVTTLQSLRVKDAEGRKVYESAGCLQHHFDAVSASVRALLETESAGRPLYSLANVLRMRRPVVVMDEAHNARTPLTFDTLTRFLPSCIVEFTATPETTQDPEHEKYASNVLHHVSARELKADNMIKLPIKLRTRGDWQSVVRDALATEGKLRELAEAEERETGEHIRPIILFQAESVHGDDVNVNVLRRELMDSFRVPEEAIAIATGESRGIEDVDLFHPDCPIRYIITVKALAEGWDCSFAYVLCSLSGVSTARAVEQVLGRILRLPHAKRKQREELNCAYAFAASEDFMQTAASLRDALIEGAGFQRMEASDFVEPAEQQDFGPLFGPGGVPHAPTRRAPAVPFSIPLLCIRKGRQLEVFDTSHLLPEDWNLAACDATLSENDFPSVVAASQEAQLDVDDAGKVKVGNFVTQLHEQVAFFGREEGWTLPSFVTWLDTHTRRPEIPQSQSSLFIHNAVKRLMETRGLALEHLARDKFRLADALWRKIDGVMREHKASGYQRMLLKPERVAFEVSPELCLTLVEHSYAPNRFYEGPLAFSKHLFTVYGEMNGEEAECAAHIDQMAEVEGWVRNVDRGQSSFWLQTSTDKFYPDFVARLKGGRVLAVEYKSVDRWSNEDSQEKLTVGKLWAERSRGRCLFVMPKGPDWQAIDGAVRG
jgi:type III restriction enzyme